MTMHEDDAPVESATGAVMWGDTVVIATTGPDASGRMRLIKSRSGEVRLLDRSQISIRMFTAALAEFCEKRKIDRLTFVYSPSAGAHMAGFNSYKIEAIIQLVVPEVELVASSAITALQARGPDGVPGPDRERLKPLLAKTQARAILATFYHRSKAEEMRVQAERQRASEQREADLELRRQALQLERDREQFAAEQREKARARQRACQADRRAIKNASLAASPFRDEDRVSEDAILVPPPLGDENDDGCDQRQDADLAGLRERAQQRADADLRLSMEEIVALL